MVTIWVIHFSVGGIFEMLSKMKHTIQSHPLSGGIAGGGKTWPDPAHMTQHTPNVRGRWVIDFCAKVIWVGFELPRPETSFIAPLTQTSRPCHFIQESLNSPHQNLFPIFLPLLSTSNPHGLILQWSSTSQDLSPQASSSNGVPLTILKPLILYDLPLLIPLLFFFLWTVT